MELSCSPARNAHSKSHASAGLKSIDRRVPELESQKQIVSKYKGKEVQLVTTADANGDYNAVTLQIIDWSEEKDKSIPTYQRFLRSPFTADYIPFGYRLRGDGEESIYLCEKLDTPSPWIRTYNSESSDSWAGHYLGNSIRNCGIIPYSIPEHYFGKDVAILKAELEALAEENDGAKIKTAGSNNPFHLMYVIDTCEENRKLAFAEAQTILDESCRMQSVRRSLFEMKFPFFMETDLFFVKTGSVFMRKPAFT